MKKQFTLREASEISGVKVETLKTKVKRNQLPSEIRLKGRKPERVISWDTLQTLCTNSAVKDYEALFTQYIDEMRAGTITTKPSSDNHIEDTTYCIERYWKLLGKKKSLEHLSAACLREVIAKIGFDDKNKRDFYGMKFHIYKAIRGFMRLLVRDGYKTKADMDAIAATKPSKKYTEAVESYPSPLQIKQAISFNLNRIKGRRDFDIYQTNTLLHLYAYTGIRKMEAAALVVDDYGTMDIDVDGQVVSVKSLRVWGKGNKRRRVPVPKALARALEVWLTEHRPESTLDNLLLTQKGTSLSESSINSKFARLSNNLGIRVMPHSIRHACATILAEEGTPTKFIQMLLGHSDIRITNRYLNSTEESLFKYFHQREVSPQPQPELVPETFQAVQLPPSIMPMF